MNTYPSNLRIVGRLATGRNFASESAPTTLASKTANVEHQAEGIFSVIMTLTRYCARAALAPSGSASYISAVSPSGEPLPFFTLLSEADSFCKEMPKETLSILKSCHNFTYLYFSSSSKHRSSSDKEYMLAKWARMAYSGSLSPTTLFQRICVRGL